MGLEEWSTNRLLGPFHALGVRPNDPLFLSADAHVLSMCDHGLGSLECCTCSAIARHLGRDGRTVKAYLEGRRAPGQRQHSGPSPLERFVPYLTAPFVDDPQVWASALYDEVVEPGYACSHPSFARQLRSAGLRPHCEACSGVRGRDTIAIEHPAGADILCGNLHRISYGEPGNMRRVGALRAGVPGHGGAVI